MTKEFLLKKTAFFLLFIALSFTGFAQTTYQPVDRKKIEEATTNDQLATHYPKLTGRLQQFDSTLTREDYRLLYYGFVFKNEYSPYSDDFAKEIKEAFDKKEYETVIEYCDKAIAKNPVSLRKYYYKLIALANLDRKDDIFFGTRRIYSALLDAIVSTGDGLTCSTAFKVISVSDEYDVMYRYFEVEKVISQALKQPCDRITITKSKLFSETKMFFDVSESFLAMEKTFKKE